MTRETDHFAGLGHFHTQEFIAFAIFAWAGLEEPHEDLSLLVILQRLHVCYDLLGSHFDT